MAIGGGGGGHSRAPGGGGGEGGGGQEGKSKKQAEPIAFLGESPYCKSNGVKILGKIGASSRIGKPRMSEDSSGSQSDSKKSKIGKAEAADPGKEFAPDMQKIKRLKVDGSVQATSEKKNSDYNSCYYEKSPAPGTHKGLATPPPDWAKNHSRICISIKQRNPIKPLSFPEIPRQTQYLQDNASHSLDQKLLEKKKKRKKKWDDLNSGACQTGKSIPREERCHSHSNCTDHSIFLCDCEKAKYCKNPADIAEGSIANSICIPGSTAETEIMTRQSCKIIDGMIKTITRSHKRQICYDGKFSMTKNFCDDDCQVKISGVDPLPLSRPASNEDKKRLATVIREEFFQQRAVPTGIESLLSVMESGDPRNGELIDDHTSLQPPLKRLPLCEVLYRNLMSVKKSDPKKYRDVMATFKMKVNFNLWKGPVRANIHLKKILDHKNRATGLPTLYDDTPEGLLHYMYNGVKHLLDHDYEQGVVQFQDYETDHIIFGTFPGVLEALQEAMSANGCLFKLD